MIKLKPMYNKDRITIEYPTKLGISFATIRPEKDGVMISVKTKYGTQPISSEDIEWVSICIKKEAK